MQTSCPISTISFNSEEYLQNVLARLIEDGIISEFYYIKHLPEDDECGNKEHIHLYVVPSSRLNTDDLSKHFLEFDITREDGKPRKCISWRKSANFADWYLYGIHDRSYLTSKGQSRRYHYKQSNVVASDDDTFYYLVSTIDLTELSPYQAMLDCIHNGITWEQYFMRGQVPISSFSNYKHAYELLEAEITYRDGRKGHE